MKKLKLLLASALLMGAVVVNAQDSTNVGQDRTGAGVGAQDQTQDQAQDQMNYRQEMTPIQPSEVPASLRSTLQGDKYKGWEDNSTIYRSKDNNEFVVEMRDGDNTKVHRFDKDGNPTTDQ